MSSPSLSHLESELVFHGRYHRNHTNQIIHFIFVPFILWSLFLLLCVLQGALGLWSLDHYHVKTIPILSFIGFFIYHVSIAPFHIAMALNVVIFLLSESSVMYYASHSFSTALYTALIIHVCGWFVQVKVGHGIYEKRSPALKDSFVRAIVAAPIALWYYGMFMLNMQGEMKEKVNKIINKSK